MIFVCITILAVAFIVGHPLMEAADRLREIADEIRRIRGGR